MKFLFCFRDLVKKLTLNLIYKSWIWWNPNNFLAHVSVMGVSIIYASTHYQIWIFNDDQIFWERYSSPASFSEFYRGRVKSYCLFHFSTEECLWSYHTIVIVTAMKVEIYRITDSKDGLNSKSILSNNPKIFNNYLFFTAQIDSIYDTTILDNTMIRTRLEATQPGRPKCLLVSPAE